MRSGLDRLKRAPEEDRIPGEIFGWPFPQTTKAGSTRYPHLSQIGSAIDTFLFSQKEQPSVSSSSFTFPPKVAPQPGQDWCAKLKSQAPQYVGQRSWADALDLPGDHGPLAPWD